MTEHPLEVELKFEAEDERPLDRLAVVAELGPARLGPARAVEETDRYLDTVDLSLSRQRWACRLRTREGRTVISLKGPGQHAAGDVLHRRPELEGPAGEALEPAAWPPSAARDLLDEMRSGMPLFERFTLRQHRVERTVEIRGEPSGLLSLDRSQIWRDGRQFGRLLVVELELDPAAVARGLDPGPLAEAVAQVPGLHPDPATKLEHALRLLEVGP